MKCEDYKCVLGNSINVCVDNDKCDEIRADVKVDQVRCKRIWGQVITCKGEPVANALVKLIKIECKDGKITFKGVAHTVTDCEGFYQFDVCGIKCKENFKILVSKAAMGEEKVLCDAEGNCNRCKKEEKEEKKEKKECDCKEKKEKKEKKECDCKEKKHECKRHEEKEEKDDCEYLLRAYIEGKINEKLKGRY